MSKLVVTLTSWPKRIHNLIKVLDSVLRNTVQPNVIFINLSVEEFPNGLQSIPPELALFINAYNSIKINWVTGPNTKSFKKITPILQYLDDDDLIIAIDDDFSIPPKLIESRLSDFMMYKGKHPITPNQLSYYTSTKGGIDRYMSPTSIFSKRMLANWENWYTPTIIATHEDDRVNTYIMAQNGFTFMPSTNFTLTQLLQSAYNISNNDSYRMSKLYTNANTAEPLLSEKLLDCIATSVFPTRDIYILWATKRPDVFKTQLNKWLATATFKHRVFVRVAVDTPSDADELIGFDTIITNNNIPGVCYPCYCLSSTFKANPNDIVIFASDDFSPPTNWDTFLEKQFTTDAVLVVNDGIQMYPNKVVTIPIMTYGALTKMNHVIYHPAYTHMSSDVELYTTAEKLGLIKDIRNTEQTIFKHEHHSIGKRPCDDVDKALDSSYITGKQILDARAAFDIDKLLRISPNITSKVRKLKINPNIKNIKLSILICSMRSRSALLHRLLTALYTQIPDNTVEVLINTDDGELSIGAKRNQLLKDSIGEYICFFDDDDMPSNDYVSKILMAIATKPDCCSLTGVMTTNGKNPEVFNHTLKHSTWSRTTVDGHVVHYRMPNHLNAVKRSVAIEIGFDDRLNKGEDFDYSKKLYPKLHTESEISGVIYNYLFTKK